MPSPSEDLGPTLIAVTTVLLGLSIIFVCLRCYVRLRLAWGFWWDDGFILLSLAFLIAGDGMIYYQIHLGVGKHNTALSDPVATVKAILDSLNDYKITYLIGSFLNKISIGLFLRRLKFSSRWFIATIWILMFLLGGITVAAIVINVIQCNNTTILGSGSHIMVVCPAREAATIIVYMQSGFSILMDLFLSISPIVVLWNAQLSLRKKIRVCGLISLGLVATVANALRNKYVYTLATFDQAYTFVVITIISELEFSLGIIAACFPSIIPLFKRRKQPERPYYDSSSAPSSRNRGAKTSKPRGWLEAAIGLDNTQKSQNSVYNDEPGRASDQSDFPLSPIEPVDQQIHNHQRNVNYNRSNNHIKDGYAGYPNTDIGDIMDFSLHTDWPTERGS